jgi:hypothetical protein
MKRFFNSAEQNPFHPFDGIEPQTTTELIQSEPFTARLQYNQPFRLEQAPIMLALGRSVLHYKKTFSSF